MGILSLLYPLGQLEWHPCSDCPGDNGPERPYNNNHGERDMDKTEFDKYVQERYLDQVNWYDKKACKNQKIYIISQWVLIVLAALTPVLVALQTEIGDSQLLYWIPIASSALVAILASSQKTFRYQENWINYRATCEMLRREYYLYQGEVDDYETATNKERLFIDRVETMLSRETNAWVVLQKDQTGKKKP